MPPVSHFCAKPAASFCTALSTTFLSIFDYRNDKSELHYPFGICSSAHHYLEGTVKIDIPDLQQRFERTTQPALWSAARVRRTSVLAEGQNLGAGGIHFARACKIALGIHKITTPKGVVILWSECNYRTWKNPGISMICRPSARGFYPNFFSKRLVSFDKRFFRMM